MTPEQDWHWPEKDYSKYLAAERHLYSWCLVTYGEYSLASASEEASRFYVYEPATAPYRGLVFHDESWHWAMRKLFGEGYWKERPEFETPSVEYNVESARLFKPEA